MLRLCLLCIIFLSSLSAGFAVVSDYNLERRLEISPGESEEVSFRIQNLQGGNDVTVRAGIREGREFATIRNDLYPVRFGTIEEVLIQVSAPRDVRSGDQFVITTAFDSVVPSEKGGIELQTGQDYSFGVLVVDTAAPILSSEIVAFIFVFLIVLVVVLIVLIWLVLVERKKQQPSTQF